MGGSHYLCGAAGRCRGALALDAECRHRFALYLSPASQLAVASDAWLVSVASRGAKGAVPAGCGFSPITWYELDVSCCSGVGTIPTWHVSPLQRVYMSIFDDWSAGRFGHRLVANSIEFHQNYHPRVGHGPCVVDFSYYEGVTKGIRDEFTLDLPRGATPILRMHMDASSSAIGVIISRSMDTYTRYIESNLEPRQWCKKEGHLWLPASPGCVLELPVCNGQVTFFMVYCPGLEDDAPKDLSPYQVLPFRVTRL